MTAVENVASISRYMENHQLPCTIAWLYELNGLCIQPTANVSLAVRSWIPASPALVRLDFHALVLFPPVYSLSLYFSHTSYSLLHLSCTPKRATIPTKFRFTPQCYYIMKFPFPLSSSLSLSLSLFPSLSLTWCCSSNRYLHPIEPQRNLHWTKPWRRKTSDLVIH